MFQGNNKGNGKMVISLNSLRNGLGTFTGSEENEVSRKRQRCGDQIPFVIGQRSKMEQIGSNYTVQSMMDSNNELTVSNNALQSMMASFNELLGSNTSDQAVMALNNGVLGSSNVLGLVMGSAVNVGTDGSKLDPYYPLQVSSSSSNNRQVTGTPLDRAEKKRLQRIKNRESAARSKSRKEAYTTGLEVQVEQLQGKVCSLEAEKEQLVMDACFTEAELCHERSAKCYERSQKEQREMDLCFMEAELYYERSEKERAHRVINNLRNELSSLASSKSI